jgi:hypothetical protein
LFLAHPLPRKGLQAAVSMNGDSKETRQKNA